ncbi:MAG: hypothetical protein LCI00_11230 [Chloroflexi bacterium]|nr:hypothetical protein [Chloroflexota bacterium]MCC6896156.1 hypothetical protein [Anaerolineae bacterium]
MVLRLLLGCLFLFALVLPVAAQSPTSTPTDNDLIAECARLLAPDRPISTAPDAPTIQLLSPTEGTVYGSAVTVNIQPDNYDVTSEGRHWHLWVNGQLMGMVYQPTAIIDLEPGTYTLCVSLGNTQHADIGMPDGVRITVEQALAGTPTATLAVDRAAAQVQPEGAVGPGQMLILVVGGLLAAVGGWWLGNKMPKGKK